MNLGKFRRMCLQQFDCYVKGNHEHGDKETSYLLILDCVPTKVIQKQVLHDIWRMIQSKSMTNFE